LFIVTVVGAFSADDMPAKTCRIVPLGPELVGPARHHIATDAQSFDRRVEGVVIAGRFAVRHLGDDKDVEIAVGPRLRNLT
jgi:hypothetical protein